MILNCKSGGVCALLILNQFILGDFLPKPIQKHLHACFFKTILHEINSEQKC